MVPHRPGRHPPGPRHDRLPQAHHPAQTGRRPHLRQGRLRNPHGTARSEWTRTDQRFELTVEVPPNTSAEVWMPAKDRHLVAAPHRATFLRMDGDHAVYRVASGSYTFVAPPPARPRRRIRVPAAPPTTRLQAPCGHRPQACPPTAARAVRQRPSSFSSSPTAALW
ncbi:alpha-L-rhamnosidase C-terminal domain-containing protein [Nonomuraea rubra]|uniref:alpha-L-rhamnosidase C-terminal domain-containing protein n=1 Tax=Nonomuraea rubra TaxID=46180 RepID=UPI0036242181